MSILLLLVPLFATHSIAIAATNVPNSLLNQKGVILIEGELPKVRREINKNGIHIKETHEVNQVKEGTNSLVTIDMRWPIVMALPQKAAAEKINGAMAEMKAAVNRQIEEVKQAARDDLSARTQKERQDWNGYSYSQDYSIERADQALISFWFLRSQYTGGAHQSNNRMGVTYDSKTGKQLFLEDITTDWDKFQSFVLEYLLRLSSQKQYQDYWFSDYASHLGEILTEDTWYFSDQGLVIIANPYHIAPYAAGIIQFVIPYEDLEYIKPEYLSETD